VTLVELGSYQELSKYSDLKTAISPSTRPMLEIAQSFGLELKPIRGFCSSRQDWDDYATGKKLKLEDFYRQSRKRLGVLMDGPDPAGGAWNFDSENRLPPPKEGLAISGPWEPVEDELDAEVRQVLDELEAQGVQFLGVDGPRRFPATQAEANEDKLLAGETMFSTFTGTSQLITLIQIS